MAVDPRWMDADADLDDVRRRADARDRVLVAQFQPEETDAARRLYERYFGTIYRYLRSSLHLLELEASWPTRSRATARRLRGRPLGVERRGGSGTPVTRRAAAEAVPR